MVDKIDRREALVLQVVGLIASAGYDSFSFADLSAASGITKASVHHYFATKEDAALAALVYLGQEVRAGFEALQALPSDQVLPGFVAMFKTRDWGATICPFSSLQAEFNVLPARLQAALQAHTQWEVAQFAQMLAQHATATQQSLRYPPIQSAQLMLSAGKGALQYGRTLGESWAGFVMEATVAGLFQPLVTDAQPQVLPV